MNIEEAIRKEELDLVKEILEKDPSSIDDRDESGIPMSHGRNVCLRRR